MPLTLAQVEKERAAGSSQSLKKCIKEMDKIIDGLPLPISKHPLREKFRRTFCQAVRERTEAFYKIGYSRGVKTLYGELKDEDAKAISFPVEKTMNVTFIPNEKPKRVKLIAKRPKPKPKKR